MEWKKNIYDVAEVERVKKDKTFYPGTILIALSAGGKPEDNVFLEEEAVAESRYAAITPHEGVNARYLWEEVQYVFLAFAAKYRQGMNLTFDALKHLEVILPPLEIQNEIVSALELGDKIKEEKEQLLYIFRNAEEWYREELFRALENHR